MALFIVESDISRMDERMARLIPKQRAFVEEMFQRGIFHMYEIGRAHV